MLNEVMTSKMEFLFDSSAFIKGKEYALKIWKLPVESYYECFGIAISCEEIPSGSEKREHFYEMWGFGINEPKKYTQHTFEVEYKGDAIADMCVYLGISYEDFETICEKENNLRNFYYEGHRW